MDAREIFSKEEWAAFVAEARPHTFLQSWNWGELNASMGHQILRYGFFEKGVLQAVALFLVIRARRGSFLFCPHGPVVKQPSFATPSHKASERHLVALAEGGEASSFANASKDRSVGRQVSEIVVSLTSTATELAKKNGCSFIRVSALMLDTPENKDLFRSAGFRDAPIHMMHPEHSLLLDLERSEDELMAGMRKTTRYSIRKAEKDGVRIFSSDELKDVNTFWKVYETTVARQHFTPFSKTYLIKELEAFRVNNKIRIFFAEYEGTVIAAAIIVFDGESAYYHHGASDQRFSKIPAAYLLQWHAIQEAKRRGCRLYNFYGVAPEGQTNHPWAGLSLFKRGFGGFEETYIHAQDRPLSWTYWITYGIETVRRIRRGL